MIESLTLENYRGFRRFELHDLGRVNLLVGTNNAGKTSVLEAISLLMAQWRSAAVSGQHSIASRRNVSEDEEPRSRGICTLRCSDNYFHGYTDVNRGKSTLRLSVRWEQSLSDCVAGG